MILIGFSVFLSTKRKIVLKTAILILLFVVFAIRSYSQSSLNGNESYFERDYFLVQHMNDLNLLIPGSDSDDRAFTNSFMLKAFFNRKEQKNRLLSVGIRSDLYTKFAGEHSFDENNRYFPSEYFTEISTVEFSLVKFLNKNFAMQWAGGLGILNKEKPITGLALWMQGGKDGAGGFHKLLHDLGKQHGQINVPRDKMSPFIYITPAVSFFVNHFPGNKVLPNTLVSELGVNLCSNFDANWVYLENDICIHVLQFPLSERTFLLDITGAGDFRLHRVGLKLDARLGAEISWGRVAFGYELTKQYGDENVDWVDFVDDDNLYRVYFKVRFKKQKRNYFVAAKNADKKLLVSDKK